MFNLDPIGLIVSLLGGWAIVSAIFLFVDRKDIIPTIKVCCVGLVFVVLVGLCDALIRYV